MKDIITDLQDMRYLSWTKSRKSSGTAGSFLKSYDDSGKVKKYYKLSDFDPVRGIVGHECVNEIIVQRLLSHLKIRHLEYRLIHAVINIEGKDYETWLCESDDYKSRDESKIALEDYYLLNRMDGETPFSFCIRNGWAEEIYGMLFIDYLVLNRDRHGANLEVLRSRKDKSVRLAPLFDHGLSFVCRCHDKSELKVFDVMEDRPVQAFVGTGSTLANIRLVPEDFINKLPPIDENTLDKVMEGLEDILGNEYLQKIRKMIRERWANLAGL